MSTTYVTLVTTAGAAALQAAIAGGTALQLTKMAVGDGSGSAVTPAAAMTALTHEVYRGSINRLTLNADGDGFVAELAIPDTAGPFTVREIGLFTAAGVLFAVGNTPSMDKTVAASGSATDMVLRMVIAVAGASSVTVTIDAGQALAVKSEVVPYLIIPGAVVAFSGTFGGTGSKFPIPLGSTTPDTSWRLCDGTGGTPDLRGKFILGASTTYTAGSTGGAVEVTPTITVGAGGWGTSGSAGGGSTGSGGNGSTGATTLSVGQMPSHNHTAALGWTQCWETDRWIYTEGSGKNLSTSYAGGGQAHIHTTPAHTHTIPAHTHTTPAHDHTATCAQVSILPPYYAMAYIMKLAPAA